LSIEHIEVAGQTGNPAPPSGRRGKKFLDDPSCQKCKYALRPTTRRCTNLECAEYRSSGPVSAGQLGDDYSPPLFHGRQWGEWRFDVERLCIVFDGKAGGYEIDLEKINQSSAMLDWIFQIQTKVWATARVTKDLLNALDDIVRPQSSLCSGACHGGPTKVIKNTKAFLTKRIRDSYKVRA
jgi:hypothetical protein